jgi:hypothetical protein
MFVEKKISLEFNEEEEEILHKMIEMCKDFRSNDVCDYLACCDCPFENICNAKYGTAKELIEELNENIQD